ncbi:MAG: DUF1579 family protein [Rubricoccaceae bacterium]|nr:DUF1579 family protein [Rubricoccaceae bacterium]
MRCALPLLLLALLAALPIDATAQDDEMEAWLAMSAPDDNHAYLEHFAGDFVYQSTTWMEPGADPMQSEGASNASMTMGGRYLSTDHSGSMMGMDFNGHGVTGYDKMAGHFVASWIDNMSTGIMVFRGHRDGDMLVLEAPWDNPMTGQTETHRIKQWPTDDGYVMEYYTVAEGAEPFKTMEIAYSRR